MEFFQQDFQLAVVAFPLVGWPDDIHAGAVIAENVVEEIGENLEIDVLTAAQNDAALPVLPE